MLQATMPVTSQSLNSFWVDSSMDRIFFLGYNGTTFIEAYKKSDFTLVGALTLTGINNATSLVRWGTDGLAFRSDTEVFSPVMGDFRDYSQTRSIDIPVVANNNGLSEF
jgi:hypothetical protein